MTKDEILKELTESREHIDTLLWILTDAEAVAELSKSLGQKTVKEHLSCHETTLQSISKCISALLGEHGEEDMLEFVKQ